MTVWKEIKDEEYYAVAIYNWAGGSGRGGVPQLGVEVGELLVVQRETSDRRWVWARAVRREGEGALPAAYLARRPAVVQSHGDTLVASAGPPGVAHEIAVALRDWLPAWRELYLRADPRFKFLEVAMRTLLQMRSQCGPRAPPVDMLRRLARTAHRTIDKGDRALGRDLSLRTPAGDPLDARTMSASELRALLAEADARVARNMEPTPSVPPAPPLAGSLAVRVLNAVWRSPCNAELLFSLHDATGTRITEPLALSWPPPPHALAAPQPHVVFAELPAELRRERLFLVCQVVRVGAGPQDPASWDGVRRPAGVAVADVARALNPDHDPETHIQLPFTPYEKENLDVLLKKVLSNREAKDTKHGQGVWVAVEAGGAAAAAAVARPLRLPEVARPGDARNDLYVTLVSGCYSRARANLELSARVVSAAGRPLPSAVLRGAGAPPSADYRSMLYHHDDRPRWQETFKVRLSIEEFKESHLVVFARHRSSSEAKDRAERPFAVSYCRLMQRDGTALADGDHVLAVYRLEPRRAPDPEEREAAAALLALPERRADLPDGAERGLTRGPLALAYKDSLTLAVRLASTKLTQRQEILGVLKWAAWRAEGRLHEALRRLLLVPGEELVKFLQDILDALSHVLAQADPFDCELGDLVLDCLLRVLALVADHKYQQFLPVLHAYIDESFCDALLYERLLPAVTRAVRCAERGDDERVKRLLQTMKCLECLLRLAARSRELRVALAGDEDEARTFARLWADLADALVALMHYGPGALTCQGAALRYLPAGAAHLARVLDADELVPSLLRWLEALPHDRLQKQRLLALLELLRGPLASAAPRMLLPHAAATAVDMLAADEEVELSMEVLGELVSCQAGEELRAELARLVLPGVLRAVSRLTRERADSDALPQRAVCVALDAVRHLSPRQYEEAARALHRDGHALAGDALDMLRVLLRRPVFPPHWRDLLLLQHQVLMHALRLLGGTVRERLADPAAHEPEEARRLCREWFAACAELAASPPLQLEEQTAPKRLRALQLHGDLRLEAARAAQGMWRAAGAARAGLLPALVPALLELSLVCDEPVREVAVPLLHEAVADQLEHARAAGEDLAEALRPLERALVDRLDALAAAGWGDERWRARWVRGAAALPAEGADLVAAAARQLDALLEYRAAGPDQLTYRMHLTLHVLRFYEQIRRPGLYVRYVHKLAELHRGAQHWAEAGLTLLLHAALLSWEEEPVPEELVPPSGAGGSGSQLELKEALYAEAAALLRRGQQWERAVEAVKELVARREARPLDYAPLAGLHAQLAELYGALRAPRSLPGYFRVVHVGRGWPQRLRGPHGFVHRGADFEQLSDFTERMLAEWPDAELLLRLDPPGPDLIESDKQYLQINAVEPVMNEELKRLSGRGVDDQLLQYCRHNNVDQFVFNRPFLKDDTGSDSETENGGDDEEEGAPAPGGEFARMWLERTELRVSAALPGVLRAVPVLGARVYWLHPLEVALEALADSARALRQAAAAAADPAAPLHPLTMRLTGVLDPAVQGGVAHYEAAFLAPAYAARHPRRAPLLARLRAAVAQQVPLLERALAVHAARRPPEVERLHRRMEELMAARRAHVRERYPEQPLPEPYVAPAPRRPPPPSPASPSPRPERLSAPEAEEGRGRLFGLNGALARYSAGGGSYFGTLQTTPRRRDKRRARKSEVSGSSQWYTSNGSEGPTSPLKELRQELVPSRPPRAEAERRLSQRASLLSSATHSNRNSIETTDSNQEAEEEEPPPLPAKARVDEPRQNYDHVTLVAGYQSTPRASFLYRRQNNSAPNSDSRR